MAKGSRFIEVLTHIWHAYRCTMSRLSGGCQLSDVTLGDRSSLPIDGR